MLVWLRHDNAGHTDKVRFVGVEYYLLGSLAYDAVDRHIAATCGPSAPPPRSCSGTSSGT